MKIYKKILSISLVLIVTLISIVAVPVSFSAKTADPEIKLDSEHAMCKDINGNIYVWKYVDVEEGILSEITEVHNVSGELIVPTYMIGYMDGYGSDGGDIFYFADDAFATVNPDIPITSIDFSQKASGVCSYAFESNLDHFKDALPNLRVVIDTGYSFVKRNGVFYREDGPYIDYNKAHCTDVNGNIYVWEYVDVDEGILSVITEVHNVSGKLVVPTYMIGYEGDYERDGGDKFYFADDAFATADPDIPITSIDFSNTVSSTAIGGFMDNIDHLVQICPDLNIVIGINEIYMKKEGTFYCASTLKYGDINYDDEISILDVTFFQRYLAYMRVPFVFIDCLADVDRDSIVSITDVTLLQRWLVGFETYSQIGKYIE